MDAEYSAYLLSDQWKAKRDARLAINSGTCSACSKTKGIHVHHLTYARIFNEDMADLLPLCEEHHAQIEQIIKEGRLPRKGNVLFLATETMRLLLSVKAPSCPPKSKKNVRAKEWATGLPEPRNHHQLKLLHDPEFVDAINTMGRTKFKDWCGERVGWSNSEYNNAFALFDRCKRITTQTTIKNKKWKRYRS